MKIEQLLSPSKSLILFSLLCLSGCAGMGTLSQAMFEQEPATAEAAQAGAGAVNVPSGQEDGYLIGPEDTLDISVWREEGLQREVLVRPDGMISFPLAGDVMAAGRTADQVSQDIRKRLSKYIPDPVVSVSVTKVAGYKIYVLGEVAKPGEFTVGRYVDVMQALTLAGGLTPYASENGIRILRREGGKEVVLPFQYSAVRSGSGAGQNIMLRSGDVVVVP